MSHSDWFAGDGGGDGAKRANTSSQTRKTGAALPTSLPVAAVRAAAAAEPAGTATEGVATATAGLKGAAVEVAGAMAAEPDGRAGFRRWRRHHQTMATDDKMMTMAQGRHAKSIAGGEVLARAATVSAATPLTRRERTPQTDRSRNDATPCSRRAGRTAWALEAGMVA